MLESSGFLEDIQGQANVIARNDQDLIELVEVVLDEQRIPVCAARHFLTHLELI
jgi:hypothetical protein